MEENSDKWQIINCSKIESESMKNLEEVLRNLQKNSDFERERHLYAFI